MMAQNIILLYGLRVTCLSFSVRIWYKYHLVLPDLVAGILIYFFF